MDKSHFCKIWLLGPVQVEQANGEKPIRFRSQRTQVLLGYLATRQRPVARDKLAVLFWPDDELPTGRANLRRELHNLNLILPNCWHSDPTAVQFTPSPNTIVDIDEARRLEAADEWVAAAHWLRGEFMEGVAIADNPELERWLEGERDRWQRQTMRVLLRAAETTWLSGEAELAERMLARLIRYAPWYEEAHCCLMLLLARHGRFSVAFKQYERCRQILTTELNVPPSATTEKLYQRIKLAAEHPPRSLPPQSISLIGREREMSDLRRHLLDPDCRLITLTGLGGMGKSRLALEVARTLHEGDGRRFLHGVAFAPLNGLTAQDLPTTIGTAAGIRFQGPEAAENQLINQLQQRELLILLDNYEAILPDTSLLEKILSEAPDITLLVTSHQRLQLQEEWVFALASLPYPSPEIETADPLTYAAVRLFTTAVSRVRPDFTFTDQQAAVLEICHLVEGMPLALLVAASWVETMSLPEIVAEIRRGLEFQQAHYRNLPPRQQNMQALLSTTWRWLTEPEQTALALLSVCQSGFTESAAQTISGASHRLLKRLTDNALIYQEKIAGMGDRYTMHNLLRQYAAAQLETAKRTEEALATHLAYFVAFAEEAERPLEGPQQAGWLNILEKEYPNLSTALRYAVAKNQWELAGRLAGALGRFWEIRGYVGVGQQWLEIILRHSEQLSPPVKAKLLLVYGVLAFEQGDYGHARTSFADSLALWQAVGDMAQTAELLNRLGHAAQHQRDWSEALSLYQQSHALYHKLGNKPKVALALNRMGHVAHLMGDDERAMALIHESLAMRRQLNDRRGMASSLNALAEMSRLNGEYAPAENFYRECLALCQELGDKRCMAGLNHNLGHALLFQERYAEARGCFEQSLGMYQLLNHQEGIALCLAGLAGVATEYNKPVLAAQLFGTAEYLLALNQASLSPADQLAWDRNVQRLHNQLDNYTVQVAWHEGQSTLVEDLLAQLV